MKLIVESITFYQPRGLASPRTTVMDPQPHQQFGPEKKARRRSSIAYDPARDTFTEISDVVWEEVVSNESHNKTSDPVQTKSNTMSSSPETRKRQHSASPANSAARNGLERAEPPQKRQRSIERDTPENGTATARPNHESQKPVSRIPRIPKVAREDGEVGNKPARTPAAFSNRRPDTNQESRRRHDDEKTTRLRKGERPTQAPIEITRTTCTFSLSKEITS